MRKTILARILGAKWPRTHAAAFPVNPASAFLAYGGARGGKVYRARVEAEKEKAKRCLEVFWLDEAARVDPNAWLSLAQMDDIRARWVKGGQNTSTMPADPWKPLTPEEILSDIKKLGEECYGVCEEIEEIFNRMKGEK